jgi:membrane-associated phospholipid phosphatase
MNAFDAAGLTFFNQFASQSPLFDSIVINMAQYHDFKGVVIMALLWGACFMPNRDAILARQIAIMSVIGGLLALVAARLMTKFLPFRDRPLYNDQFTLDYPLGDSDRYLEHWSSFPSDHAMLWFAIAVGIFLISRRVGIIAMLYTVVVICLPRIYLGLHHPTDILAGMALGAAMVLICSRTTLRSHVAGPIVGWSFSNPPIFYVLAFLLSYGLSTHFDGLKNFFKPIVYALV